jgi:HSP20 family protein
MKRSFFQRLTGAINTDEEYFDDEPRDLPLSRREMPGENLQERDQEAELAVDVSQTPNEIIIKTMVAGVNPDDLEVSISQEMVIIRGSRHETFETESNDYFHKELYWGSFARTILLPAEVKSEEAVAEIKNGLLTVRLPKVDKQKQTRLQIKTS